MLDNKYIPEITEDEVANALDAYISTPLTADTESLDQLLDGLSLDEVNHRSSEEYAVLQELEDLIKQNRKVDVSKDIAPMVDDEEIVKLQQEIIDMDKRITEKQKDIEQLQGIDEEYIKISTNLENMYFKLKTELWAQNLSIKIDTFTEPKFCLTVNYKDKFAFNINCKSKGKDIGAFSYDLLGIDIVRSIDGYKPLLQSYIKEALESNNFCVFLNQIPELIWMYTFNQH